MKQWKVWRVLVRDVRITAIVLSVLTIFFVGTATQVKAAPEAPQKLTCTPANLHCPAAKLSLGVTQIKSLVAPEASITIPKGKGGGQVVTYSVETRGAITADLNEFKSQANATYNDPRGWSRLGVSFSQVESGGLFTLVLASANEVPSFSSGCDSTYSCNVGRFVVINQDRWLGATPSWNERGGSIRDYRHMVVNYETGHWLGHGHASCVGAGQAAAVMQQQSISLAGCIFNPWPLDSELNSTRLGI